MRLSDLSEGLKHNAAVGGKYIGRFQPKTMKAYTSPKFYEILSQKLSRQTRHELIILVGEHLDRYEGRSPSLHRSLSDLTGIPAEDFVNAITLLITGDNEQPSVSPWLILHQLGEALREKKHDVWDYICEKYKDQLKGAPLITSVTNAHTSRLNGYDSQFIRAWHHLFKMRSAREVLHGVFDNIDPGPELVAEYLWHGSRVRINYPDWLDNSVVDAIKADIEAYLEAALNKLAGATICNEPQETYDRDP